MLLKKNYCNFLSLSLSPSQSAMTSMLSSSTFLSLFPWTLSHSWYLTALPIRCRVSTFYQSLPVTAVARSHLVPPLKRSNSAPRKKKKLLGLFLVYKLIAYFISFKQIQHFSSTITYYKKTNARIISCRPYEISKLKLGRNTLLVPLFRACFQFGPSVLISFDWVPFFLIRFQFYPWC